MRTRPATAAAVAAVLGLSLGLTSSAGAAPDDRPSTSAIGQARQALTDATRLFDGDARTGVTDGRDATLVLRDLAVHRGQLTGADRATAARILARPTEPGDDDHLGAADESTCGTHVCVHWTEEAGTGEAVSPTDSSPANGLPDYVDRVVGTMDDVHAAYVAAGYRPPKGDGVLGGNAKPDVYLADIGDQGLYGYCTTDQNPVGPPWDVWGYCVLDNDYSPGEFPTNTPIENMQVTAAHEYFHAVQFAYDIGEDGWFMEGTATWAEDELFDGVDDNVNYLPSGQLGNPSTPLDGAVGLNVYGNWIYFRYLTERYDAASGGMPTLVRTIWEHADAAPGAADEYSLQAVSHAIAQAGGSFTGTYAGFADGNRRPGRTYDEGVANGYPTAPLAFQPVTLTPHRSKTTWGTVTLDHLTTATALFKPKKMKAKSWRLKVQVDLTPRSHGSAAVVSVYFKNGTIDTSTLSLDAQGDGAKKVPFSSRKVRAVELTVVNASTRTSCWDDPSGTYSCYGTPKDDHQKERLRGVASR